MHSAFARPAFGSLSRGPMAGETPCALTWSAYESEATFIGSFTTAGHPHHHYQDGHLASVRELPECAMSR